MFSSTMSHHDLERSSTPNDLQTIRPTADESFRLSLRAKFLRAAEHTTEPRRPRPRWHILFLPKFALASLAALILATGAALLFSSEPVWSNARSSVRRFFMITPLTSGRTPQVKQFWSDISPDMLGARDISTPSFTNSLMQNEMLAQSPIPPGYSSISTYVIETYNLDRYSSIQDIIAHTPAEIIRQAPYYNGTLYILRFPGGYLVSYAEYTGMLNDEPSRIRSIR